MSIHIFGAVLTANGVAANNRGESEGNISTLQKLLWQGQVHTTVSAEARGNRRFRGNPNAICWVKDVTSSQ